MPNELIRGSYGAYNLDGVLGDSTLAYGLATTWHVDVSTPVSTLLQTGSIGRPYASIQDAIDAAVASGLTTHLFVVAPGTYTEDLTIPHSVDFTFVNNWRGTPVLDGDVAWTVTGNLTSKLGFRHFSTEGTITIIDHSTPAVNAVLTTEWSQLGATAGGTAVTVTGGASFVTISLVGAAMAAFATATSVVAQSVVAADILVSNSVLFVSNTQFRSTCAMVRCGDLFANGCSFEQDIDVMSATTPHAEFTACVWSGASLDVQFVNAAGVATFDGRSNASFLAAGATVANGTKDGSAVISGGVAVEPKVSGAYGSSSPYICLVLGSQTDSQPVGSGGNGALYAGARAGTAGQPPTLAPFTGLSIWDWGSGTGLDQGRILYFGGGGWGCPDATSHQFYTAAAYGETADTGVLRLHIAATGAVKVGSSGAGATGLFQVDGVLGGASARFDGGAVVIDDRTRRTAIISPTALGATQDNWNPTGLATASIIRADASTPCVLSGITAGTAGDEIDIHHVGTNAVNTITLANDTTSTAANRFLLPAATVVIPIDGCVTLWYDGTSSRWRLKSKNF